VKENGILSSAKAVLTLNFEDYNAKFKKKALLAIKSPSKTRIEIKGFWNEPVFVFVSDKDAFKAYFIAENTCYEGKTAENEPTMFDLFAGKSGGMLKIVNESNIIPVNVSYIAYDVFDTISLPIKTETFFKNSRLGFSLTEVFVNTDIDDKLFDLEIPANAKRINDKELAGIMKQWTK